MATKKFATINSLSDFLDSLKSLFATQENVTNLEDTVAEKSQVQFITWEAND